MPPDAPVTPPPASRASPASPPRVAATAPLFPHLAALAEGVQHRAAAALGVEEHKRTETVLAMLENNRRRAPGYWIQLMLSMGIATVGLVLNSTAVVIGAMLVSPLMGPIVELGMGFAVGSAFLVVRASLRVVFSVVWVVAGAALLTLSLPFHEITAEVAARAAPTALDLLVAVFCALTAAYTTVRPSSDTTSAAAGTAIGIALVPPLCTSGFGLGIGSLNISSGAALLFTANLSAILVLTVLSFLLLGYNQVNALEVEAGFVEPDITRTGRAAARAQSWLHNAFGSRYGMAVRLIIPAVVLASVYVPLRRALTEVTWEVRARDTIRAVLTSEAPRAVQTAIAVERHTISLNLLVIGTNERAASLERTVRARIVEKTGVTPTISVTAVPDAQTLAAATAARAVASPAGVQDPIELARLHQRTGKVLDTEWPSSATGPLLGWEVVVPSLASPTLTVRHLGPPLGAAGEVFLSRTLSAQLGSTMRVVDEPLASSTASANLNGSARWATAAASILDWVAKADGAWACVRGPVDSTRRRTTAQRAAAAAVLASSAAKQGRVAFRDSAGWSIRVAGQCAPRDTASGTGGASGAKADTVRTPK